MIVELILIPILINVMIISSKQPSTKVWPTPILCHPWPSCSGPIYRSIVISPTFYETPNAIPRFQLANLREVVFREVFVCEVDPWGVRLCLFERDCFARGYFVQSLVS